MNQLMMIEPQPIDVTNVKYNIIEANLLFV